mmetsp:Transcript_43449/g.70489  ORF Transcript_43449/g.70489 Transcript_43449/m.70489 type:complete len:298 (+) Transcript_43449:472-1365(+)
MSASSRVWGGGACSRHWHRGLWKFLFQFEIPHHQSHKGTYHCQDHHPDHQLYSGRLDGASPHLLVVIERVMRICFKPLGTFALKHLTLVIQPPWREEPLFTRLSSIGIHIVIIILPLLETLFVTWWFESSGAHTQAIAVAVENVVSICIQTSWPRFPQLLEMFTVPGRWLEAILPRTSSIRILVVVCVLQILKRLCTRRLCGWRHDVGSCRDILFVDHEPWQCNQGRINLGCCLRFRSRALALNSPWQGIHRCPWQSIFGYWDRVCILFGRPRSNHASGNVETARGIGKACGKLNTR